MHAWDASLIPVDFSCDIHRVSHRTTHEMHCARHVDSLTACNAPSHSSYLSALNSYPTTVVVLTSTHRQKSTVVVVVVSGQSGLQQLWS